jgi:predicted phage terminase large subunit-like protein
MLKTLPLIERERFLGKKGYGGNWNIKAEAGTIFKREWFTITNSSQNLINGIRFWDFGATTLKNIRTGDFTVGLLLFYNSSEDNYLIKDIIRIKLPPAHTNKLLLETAYKDGQNIMIRWQQEPGASGVRDSLNIQNILKGFNAKGIIDNRDKVSRALPLSYLVEQGKFNLQIGEWNNDFLSEAEGFPDISKHDDQVDALSGAFNEICRPKFRESNFKY